MTDSTDRPISRRQFIAGAGGAVGAYGMLATPASARARRSHVRRQAASHAQVAVLGGGVGGLTAAHELAERGFNVTVVEPGALGGKARSIPVPGTGTGGRADLPGEHGFRFFPGFYKNVPDTMRRIPVAGNAEGVFDNLVNASQELLIFPGSNELWALPSFTADGPRELISTLVTAIGIAAGVPANEIEYFIRKMLVFFTSCDARRVGEWEYVGWWEYVNAAKFSPKYQQVFGSGLTKDLVAAKGTKASTRVIGLMAEAFVYALAAETIPAIASQSGYASADRLLDAPTNDAWIDPWVAHLSSLGVRFRLGSAVTALQLSAGRVTSATLTDGKGRHSALAADWFVCAMPVERIVRLLSPKLLAADPALERLRNLQTDWMNGIQFFLNRPPAVPVNGHVAFLESPWALTSIDQGLFWKRDIAKQYGDGTVADVYSIDISDFFTPGILYGKPAAECSPQQIAAEVWAQIKQGLNRSGQTVLNDDMLVRWFLDPAISHPAGPGGPAANSEPLLINTAGALDDQPTAATSVPNLFLASDYVRTNVGLATMEGANEAGRQAVNALLAQAGSTAAPATLGTLWQPSEFAGAYQLDAERYRRGEPNIYDIVPSALPL